MAHIRGPPLAVVAASALTKRRGSPGIKQAAWAMAALYSPNTWVVELYAFAYVTPRARLRIPLQQPPPSTYS
ncbi:hypothetical protein MRX96_002435 [Rhipicephalus microplus]